MNQDHSMDEHPDVAVLEARIADLEAALRLAYIDPQFAILTRAGIDQRWHARPAAVDTVIFFDIDRVHTCNEQWGYAGTDSRIQAVMAAVPTTWVFRWYSGDEFGLLCSEPDAAGYAARVEALLKSQGMSATFGIGPIVDSDLKASVSGAAALVQAAKAAQRRGTINRATHGPREPDTRDAPH